MNPTHVEAGTVETEIHAPFLTDDQLLNQYVAQRDPGAFEQLLLRHGPMVFSTCLRILKRHHEAEDAYQMTFLSLASNAATVTQPQMLAGWLYAVARNAALKLKKIENQLRESPMLDPTVMAAVPSAAVTDQWSEVIPLLDDELVQLPQNHRVVLILCDIEGRTRHEAAQQLGWPAATVSSRLVKARDLLATRLKRRGVALTSATIAVLLTQNGASAAVPATLVSSTLAASASIGVQQIAATSALVSLKSALGMASILKLVAASVSVFVAAVLLLPPQIATPVAAANADDLVEIQKGIEATFRYLHNHSLKLDLRIEDFAGRAIKRVDSTSAEGKNSEVKPDQIVPYPHTWTDQIFRFEESRGRYFTEIKSGNEQSEQYDTHLKSSIFGNKMSNLTLHSTTHPDYLVKAGVDAPHGNEHRIVDASRVPDSVIVPRDWYLRNLGYICTSRYERNRTQVNSTLGIESNYVNLQFLPICFKFVKYKIAAEKELVDGDWCTVLEAPKGVDKIWIDTNHGYLIRKRILKRPIYRTAPGQLAWVRNTNAKLDQVAEGIWLPRKMISEEFTEAPPGDTELWEPRRTQTVTARSIEVGGPLPDEQYLIAFPAGTIVDTDYHYGRAASRFVAKGDETRFDEIGNLIRSNSDVEQEVGPDPSNAGKPGSQAAWGTMDYLPCNFDRTWRDWCVLILTCNFWLAIGVAGFFVFRRFVRESRKRKTDVAKS